MSSQQILLGAGSDLKKQYVDEVFSTYLYDGSGGDQTITNGIDLASEGGLTWIKNRTKDSTDHALVDTVRGAGFYIRSNQQYGNGNTGATTNFNSFTSTGFTLKNDNGSDYFNNENSVYASWSFRKAKGFFDVVTYTGGTSPQNISHSLGCVPGLIIVKATSETSPWIVYHKDLGSGSGLFLNSGSAEDDSGNNNFWNNTAPTSSVFTVGVPSNNSFASYTNKNNETYIAYVFAGGESIAATARSVNLQSDSNLTVYSTGGAENGIADFGYGTGDFTWEAYIRIDDASTEQRIINHRVGSTTHGGIYIDGNTLVYLNNSGNTIEADGGWRPNEEYKVYNGQWYHVAVSRNSGTTRLFLNGAFSGSVSDTHNYANTKVDIGSKAGSNNFKGDISNVRIIKGTGLYTSSFIPSTKPLTNITNTVLLCCQNSTVTGSTVLPSSTAIEANSASSATASTDSPFNDPASFKFSDARNQNVIKCGSFIGNGSWNGPEIHLGWEPQWVLIKNSESSSTDWMIHDSMRRIETTAVNSSSHGPDNLLQANSGDDEYTSQAIDLTPTGFVVRTSAGNWNTSGKKIIYVAIRRPDGYVSKPITAGSDLFTMATGNSSDPIPAFTSNFPVDFAFHRRTAQFTSESWYCGARLMGEHSLRLDTNDDEGNSTSNVFDSNIGWHKGSYASSNRQSWMFKRGQGFDVVGYRGNFRSGRQIRHSLNAVPEMIWVKSRSGSNKDWVVGHKGINIGNSPWDKHLVLNRDDVQEDEVKIWNDTAPTSTHFTLGNDSTVNDNYRYYLALLFTSVDGISKCGYYNGSNSTITVTTGFQPRFVIIKRLSAGGDWNCLDTLRGWGTTSVKVIYLNENAWDDNQGNISSITSTGFTLTNNSQRNAYLQSYIYYAHA